MKYKTPFFDKIDRFSPRKLREPFFRLEIFSHSLLKKDKAEAYNLEKKHKSEKDWNAIILFGILAIFFIFIAISFKKFEYAPKPKPIIHKPTFQERVLAYQDADYEEILKWRNVIRAEAYLKKKNYEKAFSNFNNAITHSPYDWRPRVKLFYAYSECCLKSERFCGNAQKDYRSIKEYLPPPAKSVELRKSLLAKRELVRLKLLQKFRRNGEFHKILKSENKFMQCRLTFPE